MAGTLFRLFFVILLALSHLLCLKAVPVTRTESLTQDSKVHLTLENTYEGEGINERNWHWEESTNTERMDLEQLDYNPPGANGHHTPKAP